MHFYTVLGVLLSVSGAACAISALAAKELSNVKMGLAMAALCVTGAAACFVMTAWVTS